MKGYKATYNMKCNELTYEVGKTYSISSMEICTSGFHFCVMADSTLYYYPYEKDKLVLLEVEALGEIKDEISDKLVTDKLKVIRVVPKEEYNSVFSLHKFDDKWNLVKVCDKHSDDALLTNTYDDKGNLVRTDYISGYSDTFKYDEEGRLVYKDRRPYYKCYISYNENEKVVCAESYNFNRGVFSKIPGLYAEQTQTKTTYDKNDNIIHIKYSDGQETHYEYDDKGNLIKIIQPDATILHNYDEKGRIVSIIHSNDFEQHYKYNDDENSVYHYHKTKLTTGADHEIEEYKKYDDKGNLIHYRYKINGITSREWHLTITD